MCVCVWLVLFCFYNFCSGLFRTFGASQWRSVVAGAVFFFIDSPGAWVSIDDDGN